MTLTPIPYETEGAGTRQVLDGKLVWQNGAWWLKVDGSPSLWGPVENASPAVAGDRACVIVSQQGTLYVVWPAGGGVQPGTGDKFYVYTQGPPSATWVVTHNLNKQPAVAVVDTGDSVVIPSVHYDDPNQVTITFGSPTSGKAYLN